MKIIIPMAGRGSRFEKEGYTLPKPLIEINKKPMISWVYNSLNLIGDYIFLVRKEHYEKFNLEKILKEMVYPNTCEIIQVDGITEGAACTVLLAEKFINNEESLLIANSDQWIDWDSRDFLGFILDVECDGCILTFKATDKKWSYAKLDENNYVSEVAEKNPISEHATVGIYYYKNGSEFVKYAKEMISKNIRTNNEFYVAPIYNEYIKDKKLIEIYPVDEMLGLGTPEDLNIFLDLKVNGN